MSSLGRVLHGKDEFGDAAEVIDGLLEGVSNPLTLTTALSVMTLVKLIKNRRR